MNQSDDKRAEFAKRVTEMAARKVGYAAERNILQLLADLEAQQSAFADAKEEGIEMTIKLRVTAPRPLMATMEVANVSWAAKIRRVDKDFEMGEVDLDQLGLPGFEDCKVTVVDGNEPGSLPSDLFKRFDTRAWYALYAFATMENLRIIWDVPPRSLGAQPAQGLCKLHPLESEESAQRALELADEDKKTICVKQGWITAASVAKLAALGCNVYKFAPGEPLLVYDDVGASFVPVKPEVICTTEQRRELLSDRDSASVDMRPWQR